MNVIMLDIVRMKLIPICFSSFFQQAVEDLLEGEDEDFDRDDKVIITHGDL